MIGARGQEGKCADRVGMGRGTYFEEVGVAGGLEVDVGVGRVFGLEERVSHEN